MQVKTSYNASLLDLVDKYLNSGGKTPYSTRDIAQWAVKNGHWDRDRSTAVTQCARDLSRALREDDYQDSKGRNVRARHAVRVPREMPNGKLKQLKMWDDHRTMSGDFAQRSFQQRRMQIVGDCKQLKTDVDSFNDCNESEEPIQLILDFTYDVAEDELGGETFRPNQPR